MRAEITHEGRTLVVERSDPGVVEDATGYVFVLPAMNDARAWIDGAPVTIDEARAFVSAAQAGGS